jgi:mono/diheme cytochrome c family protein
MTMMVSASLGVVFLVLSVLATFTMYKFWGYAYDKERRLSACPRWKMNIHRALGYAYVLLYVIFMIEMLPRLWAYQVEFPARTVAHISLGITIGVILLVKISILRFFRHFEEWMPALGTLLMLCTFLLIGLSVPFMLKERALAAGAVGGGAFSAESRARVAALLPEAGLPEEVKLEALSTERSLRAGRRVLLNQCVYCHDLKTAIASPRTPSAWLRTVRRMAEKPTLGAPITEPEQHQVTAYLVAITPDLQRSERERRQETLARDEDRRLVEEALPAHGPARPDAGVEEDSPEVEDPAEEMAPAPERRRRPAPAPRQEATAPPAAAPSDAGPAEPPAHDAGVAAPPPEPEQPERDAQREAAAAAAFERHCALCHGVDEVHAAAPSSVGEIREVIHRMVGYGMSASERELRLIEEHMVRLYGR